METLLLWIGRVAGIVGAVLVLIAVASRLVGAYYLGSFQLATLLQVGIACMIVGCLGYLASMAERRRPL